MSWLLGGLVLLSASAFVWLVRDSPGSTSAPPAAQHGAALFDRHCASCHDAGALAEPLRAGRVHRADWERFLRDHGESDDAEDRAILDFLGASPDRD